MSGVIFYCIQVIVLRGPPEGQDHTVSEALPRMGLLAEASGYSASGLKSIDDSFLLYHVFKPCKLLPMGNLGQNKLASCLQESGNSSFIPCVKHKSNFVCIVSSCFKNGFL